MLLPSLSRREIINMICTTAGYTMLSPWEVLGLEDGVLDLPISPTNGWRVFCIDGNDVFFPTWD